MSLPRAVVMRDAIAERLKTIDGTGEYFGSYDAAGQVVVGSDELPALVPGWRVTFAVDTPQAVTFSRAKTAWIVYVELYLAPPAETQDDRQIAIAKALEDARVALRYADLRDEAVSIQATISNYGPGWEITGVQFHDARQVAEAGLPDAQITIRCEYLEKT